ncbi:MAG: PAS domain S-box protein [Dehalococcoidales bacterium]
MHRTRESTAGGDLPAKSAFIEDEDNSSLKNLQYNTVNEWYTAFIQNACEGFFLSDLNCNILYVNDAFCKMSGYSRIELLSMNAADLILKTPAEIKKFKNNVEKAINKGESSFEVKSKRKDGHILDLAVSYRYMDVAPGFIFCAHRDVTEQNKINRELIESEERYNALVALGGRVGEAVIIMQDIKREEGVQTFVSDEWVKITGYPMEELLGMPFFNLLKPEYYSASLDRYRRKMKGEVMLNPFEMEIIRKDGVIVNIEFTSVHTNYKGKIANVAYIRDITERKRVENAVKESESRLQSVLSSIDDWVYVFDKEARFISCHPEPAKEIYELKKDFIGKKHSEVMPANLDKLFSAAFNKNMNGMVADYEFSREVCDKKRWINVKLSPMLIDGEFNGAVAVIRDVTQRKQAEQKLKESQKELRTLSVHLQYIREAERKDIAYRIHEELGQLLAALKMDISWLQKQLLNQNEVPEKKMEDVLKLINMSIQIAKSVSAELKPGLLYELGLLAAIECQTEEFFNLTGIKCNVSSTPAKITVDQELSITLFSVFQELLTNVYKHAEATVVDIGLRKQCKKITLIVNDNGKGITEEQINAPRSLGLIGIRERIQYWGGTVTVIGIPGEGTHVTINIPLNKKGGLTADESSDY